ncbi:MAG: amidohydrolase family protein, partial [Phycisphaerales bacterium]|nr:amidohydrolase family protein [Phycisphaerales bacterium]
MKTIFEADFTWTGDAFERGIRVVVEDGRITEVDTDIEGRVTRLSRRALLPGFVNAHSHAFQRGLRGRGETFPNHDGSFWSWREAMYDLVGEMTRERLYELSLLAFREMLEAGITTVGEFHYLHHPASEAGFAFDEVMLHAARDAGIRIVLLHAYYATGAIGQPLQGGQRRFACTSPAEYWDQIDHLQSLVDGDMQRLGVVAHSIRAAALEDIAALHAEAERRGLVFHMHIEEQVAEIEQAQQAYGRTPMGALFDTIAVNPRFTGVHCTHTAPDDMARFIAAGASVCICPLTEANLGDG